MPKSSKPRRKFNPLKRKQVIGGIKLVLGENDELQAPAKGYPDRALVGPQFLAAHAGNPTGLSTQILFDFPGADVTLYRVIGWAQEQQSFIVEKSTSFPRQELDDAIDGGAE
jgi:hypothetical protein